MRGKRHGAIQEAKVGLPANGYTIAPGEHHVDKSSVDDHERNTMRTDRKKDIDKINRLLTSGLDPSS
jgi:hypothetical protein